MQGDTTHSLPIAKDDNTPRVKFQEKPSSLIIAVIFELDLNNISQHLSNGRVYTNMDILFTAGTHS